MKPAIRQTAMRRSIYAQLALDAAAVAVELWFFWGDGANFVPVLVLMLLSAVNICWLWMLLQYRQIKAVSDEAGLALLRIWLAGDVLICVSMLGMYLPAELILG